MSFLLHFRAESLFGGSAPVRPQSLRSVSFAAKSIAHVPLTDTRWVAENPSDDVKGIQEIYGAKSNSWVIGRATSIHQYRNVWGFVYIFYGHSKENDSSVILSEDIYCIWETFEMWDCDPAAESQAFEMKDANWDADTGLGTACPNSMTSRSQFFRTITHCGTIWG